MNALPWTIYLSLVGAVLAGAAGRAGRAFPRWVALGSALAGLVCTIFAAADFLPAPGLVTLANVNWIPEFGVRYHLAADGISLTLTLLTGIAATAGILFSWETDEPGGFFSLYLLLIAGVYGTFLSADAFLLFVFYEVAIIPKYFLIARWGSTNREYGAMKLVLYSFGGSALVFAGLLWAWAASGGHGFALADLAAECSRLAPGTQAAMFLLVFAGFAVLAGLVPFHTWAPTGHVAAPTGVSMLLAGVVMKLGAYGCLRVALPLFPAGFDFWQPVIGWLAAGGIVYAGLVALVQDDFKFVIGYSSVAHMGFVLLGLAAATAQSFAGAVLQMFSHGIVAGLLFAVVGSLVYDRTHTRQLDALSHLPLHRLLPFATVVFVLAGAASMGLPGFSGFPAELTILTGTWLSSPWWTGCAAVGIIVSGAFTLRALQRAFLGRAETGAPASPESAERDGRQYPRVTIPEKAGTLLLLATSILIGLKPDLLLNWIVPALQSPYFQTILKGGQP